MATTYFVNDDGASSDGTTWETAHVNFKDLLDAVSNTFVAGDVVVFGSDTVDGSTYGASTTITLPASGQGVLFISSTVGSGTAISYAAGTAFQIMQDESSSYSLTFDGAHHIKGLRIRCDGTIYFSADSTECSIVEDCYIKPGSTVQAVHGQHDAKAIVRRCVYDGSGNTGGQSPFQITGRGGIVEMTGCSFYDCAGKTGGALSINSEGGELLVSGCDFTNFTNSYGLYSIGSSATSVNLRAFNCKLPSGWVGKDAILATSGSNGARAWLVNCTTGADDPTYLEYETIQGKIISSSNVREGGAQIEGTQTAWKCVTTTVTSEDYPFATPWLYAKIASAGTKTITIYVQNNYLELDDADIWIEAEVMGTSDQALSTFWSSYRGGDGTSHGVPWLATTTAWGTGGATTWTTDYTYQQALTLDNLSVGEEGLIRCRVVVAYNGFNSTNGYLYIDPEMNIS